MAAVNGPFEYRATGVLGDKRETMLVNELHGRNKLGKVFRRGRDLPEESWTYGEKNVNSSGGVADAFAHWGVSLPMHHNHTDQPKTERDFVAMNRAALSAGLVTAPEHFAFRASCDIRRLTDEEQKKQENKFKSRRLPPNMVFGLSTRPSTPIWGLIEHKYQDEWINERRSEMSKQRKKHLKQLNEFANGNFAVNRTMALRMHQDTVEPQPLWKMPKFSKNAKPHVSSFRSKSAREASYQNYDSDKIPRRGVEFKHGIDEPAQS